MDIRVIEATLKDVLEYNAKRFEEFKASPFCRAIQDGTLEDETKRDIFLACVQTVSRSFQTIMFTRQALCSEPRFSAIFLEHLSQELGHDKLIADRSGAHEVDDVLLEAILSWFSYNMMVLDNVEKAALVHLVMENAGDYAHTIMVPVLGEHVRSRFFEAHAECDAAHASMASPLFEDLHPRTYGRLIMIVRKGWDMMGEMTTRMLQLVQQ